MKTNVKTAKFDPRYTCNKVKNSPRYMRRYLTDYGMRSVNLSRTKTNYESFMTTFLANRVYSTVNSKCKFTAQELLWLFIQRQEYWYLRRENAYKESISKDFTDKQQTLYDGYHQQYKVNAKNTLKGYYDEKIKLLEKAQPFLTVLPKNKHYRFLDEILKNINSSILRQKKEIKQLSKSKPKSVIKEKKLEYASLTKDLAKVNFLKSVYKYFFGIPYDNYGIEYF